MASPSRPPRGTPSSIVARRAGANGSETPAQAIERLRAPRQLGITRLMGRIPNAHEPGAIELLGREVVPAAGDLA